MSADLGRELERAGAEHGDLPAISDATTALSYSELLAEAAGLAATLPPVGERDPRPVALAMPHNARTVVALVACLLAGRPYCVLNPFQPRRRIESLLTLLEAEVIWVADEARQENLEAIGLPARLALPARRGPSRPPARDRVGDVCGMYVTSGSSGTPKLVGYRHVATIHRARLYGATLEAGPGARFALGSPPWTGASVSALCAALLSGSSVELLDAGRASLTELAARIEATAPTVWHSAPSVFRRVAGAGLLDGNAIRFLRFAGEPLLRSDVELARRVCSGDTALVMTYGLTEANGIATQSLVPLAAEGDAHTSSGPPLGGVEVWIEGDNGRPLPQGAEGEIVIGGEFLSAGYLGPGSEVEEGTRFTRRNGALVLHTGDLGVLTADGSLEVRGRADRRLNIRGSRTDPAEVEAAALSHDGVTDAAAVPFTTRKGAEALALFAATAGPADEAASVSLRTHVADRVPPEALPAKVELMRQIPRGPGGKVDRLRLARVAEQGSDPAAVVRGRLDPLVVQLARLWAETLEMEEPGPDEDFFALGGDSLAAAEACAAMESLYGVPLEPAVMLVHRSPQALAAHLRGILDGAPHVPPGMLQLNPSGEEPPLALIPGAGSDATAMVHFAEAIGEDQPVTVIQLPGADGRSAPATRMGQLAGHCRAVLESSGLEPPYRIAGSSFGGYIAFALAAELASEDVGVEYLGLFDTPGPPTRSGHHLTRPLKELSEAPSRANGARKAAVAYRRTLSVLTGRHGHPPDQRFRYLRIGCSIAADRWRPSASPVPTHLYRCRLQPPHLEAEPALGWDELAPNLTVRRLDSGHGRHIRPPAVNELADLVADDLASAGRGAEPAPAPAASG